MRSSSKSPSASVDGKALPQSAIKIDNEERTAHARACRRNLRPEITRSRLVSRARSISKARAFSTCAIRSRARGAKKIMLGTQFEATDARRFFPCWDEPSFRARFQLTRRRAGKLARRLEHADREARKKSPAGKKCALPRLRRCRVISMFSSRANSISIESRSGRTQIRVITTKGKAELGRYALEVTAQILQYYNDYFGVPYPLPKLDQIALPGGFGGAMENWGGITYYESALLFDPKNSSAETQAKYL